jgi:hypothetical protein
MIAASQQPNVKNGQPALDFQRPFMDDKRLSISGRVLRYRFWAKRRPVQAGAKGSAAGFCRIRLAASFLIMGQLWH